MLKDKSRFLTDLLSHSKASCLAQVPTPKYICRLLNLNLHPLCQTYSVSICISLMAFIY